MKKTFEGKFPNNKRMRCPRCDLPVIDTINTRIVHACAGCGRSFVRENEKMVTIEEYLDPEHIFQFENYANLSPTFQNLLREERNRYEMNSPMNKMGIVVDHLERYKGWAEHGMGCLQTNQMEEGAYSMIMALHDFQINPGFWLNIAQIATNFDMFEISDRAVAIARKLDPNYEALNRIVGRLNTYRRNWKLEFGGLNSNQKRSLSVNKIAEESLRNGNFPRAFFRLKQVVEFDPSFQMGWNNLASVSFRLDDISMLKKAIEKSLSINPRNPNAHYFAMNIYISQNNFPMAIQKVKDALALDPNNQRFQAKLRQLENAMMPNNIQFSPPPNKTSRRNVPEYRKPVKKIGQNQKSARKINIWIKIKKIFDDPMKFIGNIFCIFTILALLSHFLEGPMILQTVTFIIALITGSICLITARSEIRHR
ncbi:MAG: tetratricopeptide repeat protein [Promethearchaeota archaeon]